MPIPPKMAPRLQFLLIAVAILLLLLGLAHQSDSLKETWQATTTTEDPDPPVEPIFVPPPTAASPMPAYVPEPAAVPVPVPAASPPKDTLE